LCASGIESSGKLGVTPYLIRFHSLAAKAQSEMKQNEQSKEHMDQAAAAVEKIRKELNPEYVEDFLKVTAAKIDSKH